MILPYPPMLPENSAAHFRRYVEEGGALVAEARLGWNKERGFAADRIPGMGLWEVMGCRETAVQTGAQGRTELRWTAPDFPGVKPGDVLPARWYEETLEPLSPEARVVAAFSNGEAAAVESRFGRGKTLMLGSYVSAAYQSNPSPVVERFYSGLLEWAGVDLPVSASGGALEVRHLESGSNALLFVFNHGAQPVAASAGLRLPAGRYGATDLIAGQQIDAARDGDSVRIRGTVDPQSVWVVRLTPQ